jgi:hypothetical protein
MPRGVKRGRGGGMIVSVLCCVVLCCVVWLRGGCVLCLRVAQMVATTRLLALVMTVRV